MCCTQEVISKIKEDRPGEKAGAEGPSGKWGRYGGGSALILEGRWADGVAVEEESRDTERLSERGC